MDALQNPPNFYDIDILLKLVNSYSCADASRSKFGETPLIQTVSQKYPLRVVDLVLKSNLQAIKLTDEMGDLPLDVAVKGGSPLRGC